MSKTVNCRYCGETFVAEPRKPGYVDECRSCIHERSRPPIDKDFVTKFEARFPERARAF